MRNSGQAGFSLLGVLIAVMIIGIVAAIAVPKFNSAIASANTAKVEADLSTLDSAIMVYEAEHGLPPKDIDALDGYVNDVSKLKPPKGKCLLKGGGELTVEDGAVYELTTESDKMTTTIRRAALSGHKAGDFGK